MRAADRAELRKAGAVAREAAQIADSTGRFVGLARTAFGHCLNQEVAAFGDEKLAAEAIKACDAALQAPDLDQGDRATMLSALAHLHSLGGRPESAATAERYLREALAITDGDALRSVRVQLAGALTHQPSGDLDEAADLARGAMAGLPADHWVSVIAALALAAALQKRFERDGRLSDLDEAVSVAQTAWKGLPADQPKREVFAELTRQLLWQRAQHRPDRTHFDEAIHFQRSYEPDATAEAIGLGLRGVLAGDHASREEAEAALRAVLARGELDADQAHHVQALLAAIMTMGPSAADVANSVATLERLMESLPEDSPVRARLLPMYLAALGAHTSLIGDPAILDRAVTLARDALARDVMDDDVRDSVQAVLAGTLLSRFQLLGRTEDLEAAIVGLRAAEDRAAEADPQRGNRLALLAKAWLLRYRRTGERAALAEAVEAAEAGARVAYDGQRAMCLAQLAEALWARHEASGDEADARRASALEAQIRGASAIASMSGMAPAMFQQTAAQQHLARYERTGDVRDVERAVGRLRSLLDSGRLPQSQRRNTVGQLAVSLRMRHERKRVLADIEESVALLRQCVADEPSEIARAGWLSALGESLRARFATTGDRSDIDTAVEHHRESLDILDRHRFPSPLARCALVSALLDRAELAGDPEDLHAAVDVAQEITRRQDIDAADRAAADIVLATALWSRYKYLGERDDLDRSVEMWQHARDALPAGHRRQVLVLHNLAGVLRLRYETLGHAADLDAAIATNRAALAAIPADHPDRPAIQSGLAILLQNQFVDRRDAGALDESVAQGISGTLGSRIADRAGQLHVYAQSLYLRYLEHGRARDLRRATRLLRASVAGSDEHNPKFATRLSSLGLALQGRYERTGRRRYRAEALAALDRAAGLATAPAEARLHAAHLAGQLHAHHGDVDAAAAAYRLAIQEVLPQVVWRGLGVVSHQSRLRDFPRLASDAAALAIEAGDPVGALRLLEQGRTLLWAQSLDARSDRSLLRAEHPELHARLDHVITQLAGATASGPRPDRLDTTDYRDGVAYRWRLHQEYTRLLAEIRALPDQRFAGFLAPPDVSSLRAAAQDGPIVVVNVSTYRCDALVVAPDRPTVEVVRLPHLTAEDVAARARVFAAAIQTLAPGTDLAEQVNGNQSALSTLEWLWRAVTQPVLAHLRLTPPAGGASPPRLWWCPTGQLSLLPLHAAGSADDWVGAYVVSSYTPTLRSLLHHRGQTPARPSGNGALIVALPSTPPIDGIAFTDLAAVPAEVAAVRERLPGDHTVMSDGNARKADILAALEHHRVLHFSCHGVQDPRDPAASYLAVADGPLRVRHLARRVTHATLAFLSACETARGDTELADEALHLVAAFNFAGARHVIGTLWSIGDTTAAVIAEDVYTHIAAGGHEDAVTATALHRAVTRLRESLRGNAPLRWAAYVHHGP
ncbi:CHAT domain-containing protein [Phytohabitans sp. LJ34]